MVTTRSGQGSAPAPLPSFEELLRNKQVALLTDEAKRLRWVLDGPLTSAISVLKQPYHDPDTSPEPYCTSQGGHLTWHAVAQAPYTEPKISSVTVSVTQINDWEEEWRELHLGCAVGSNGDEDPDNYDWPSECTSCEEQRPNPQDMTLMVKASGEFVTVHDYVSAVHPWLLGKYDDLLGALAVLKDEPRLSLPAGQHLIVTFGGPDDLSVGTEEDWLLNKDKETYLLVGQTPVNTETANVELGADHHGGPPPGYTGVWPIPYRGALAADLSHLGITRFGS